MSLGGGSMVGRAGGHDVSSLAELSGNIHNPQDTTIGHPPPRDTYVYKVSNENS